MEWQIIIALIVAIPLVLIPVAFIWYMNIGGIYAVIKEAREKRIAHKKKALEEIAAERRTNS